MKLDSTLLCHLALAATLGNYPILTNAAQHPFHLRQRGTETTTISDKGRFHARNQKTRGLNDDSSTDDTNSGNSSTAPTQLAYGTELFQDTVYSESVIAQNVPYSHAVIEGARGRLKLQSNLSSSDPSESQFLDTNYHLGSPEVIQFEQNTTTSDWELVHYRYPWQPRSDNVRTDALERIVIMDSDDGLDSPTGVWSITGTFTNRIYSAGNGTAVTNMKYALFVQQSSGDHFVVIGCGVAELAYDSAPAHPLTWSFLAYNDIADAPSFGDINSVDKYTSASWSTDYRYDEYAQFSIANGVEHIIIYGTSNIVVLSLLDYGQLSTQFSLQKIQYYDSDTSYRVLHMEWTPPIDDSSDSWYFLNNVTLATTSGDYTKVFGIPDETNYYGGPTYYPTATSTGFESFADGITYAVVTLSDDGSLYRISHSDEDYSIDMGDIESIHDLYSIRTTEDGSSTKLSMYNVKLANVKDAGIYVLIHCVWGDFLETQYSFLCGAMKLDFPDLSGMGEIINFSGGTTKFGGFRFIASDENGNLFLMRQRSAASDSSTPYEIPIYGLWDEEGSPISDDSFEQTYVGPPANTSSSSNLQDIDDWVSNTNCILQNTIEYQTATKNLILGAASMFSTDETSVAQGYWLGTGFQASYSLKRFGQDSSHVVVTESSSDGSETSYSVQAVYKEPVTKKWHKRQISTQSLSTELGEYDTGDHYHVTITVTNDAGQAVSLDEYANVLVEVRSDYPCTAVDDTNNYYHDLDRYTSFTAAPSARSSSLDVVVKASGFSQVLYARLITSTTLNQTSSDSAMLDSSSVTYSSWVSIKLASEAQARMANGVNSSSNSRRLTSNSSLADTTVYINPSTLNQSIVENEWALKDSFTADDQTLTSLTTLLNSAGSTMSSGTEFSDDSDSAERLLSSITEDIDPLTTVSTIQGEALEESVVTTVVFANGLLTSGRRRRRNLSERRLSFWSSFTHTLSDALHYVENAGDALADSVTDAVVEIEDVGNQVYAMISADIMEALTGVNSAFSTVVSTVEQYAAVVENIVSSIVEVTFDVIEFIIALISLFLYFEDIVALSHSLMDKFEYYFDSAPTLSDTFNCYDTMSKYMGIGNQFQETINAGSDSEHPVDEFTSDSLSVLTSMNPLAKKIFNKISAMLTKVEDKILDEMPLTFGMNESFVSEFSDTLDDFESIAEDSVATLGFDLITGLVTDVSNDATNPQNIFSDVANTFGDFLEGFADDVTTSTCDLMDDVASSSPQFILDQLKYDDMISISDKVLVDFLDLFGVGTLKTSTLNLSGKEMVFFPTALIYWALIYTEKGQSIKSFDEILELDSDNSALTDNSDDRRLEYSDSLLDLLSTAAGSVIKFISGTIWWAAADTDETISGPLGTIRSWMGMIKSVIDLMYLWYAISEFGGFDFVNGWALGYTSLGLFVKVMKYYSFQKGQKWMKVFQVLMIVLMIVNTAENVIYKSSCTDQSYSVAAHDMEIVGGVVMSIQSPLVSIYSLCGTTCNSTTPIQQAFTASIVLAPLGGLVKAGGIAEGGGNTYQKSGSCSTPAPTEPPTTISPTLAPSMNPSFTYLGCFKDEPTRDISERQSGSFSLSECLYQCQEDGYYYAGLQYGYECFCGDSYGSYGTSSGCTMDCTDGPGVCGGGYANSVYQVNPVPPSSTPTHGPSFSPTPSPTSQPSPSPTANNLSTNQPSEAPVTSKPTENTSAPSSTPSPAPSSTHRPSLRGSPHPTALSNECCTDDFISCMDSSQDDDWCNESAVNCDECSGFWMVPQTNCVARFDECTNDSDCCQSPSTTVQCSQESDTWSSCQVVE